MKRRIPYFIAYATFTLAAAPASGEEAARIGGMADSGQPYLQCVPYARQVSGIQIYGDAWTWWDQAEGLYQRGSRPKVGAVMAFQPHGNMQLGHVAAVSKVLDSRTVLLRHANWSPIEGRRGQIENDVRAVDVSEKNDWSMVRVWYDPIQSLGTTAWPVEGFIYSDKAGSRQAAKAPARLSAAKAPPAGTKPGPRRDIVGEIIAQNPNGSNLKSSNAKLARTGK